MTQHFVIIKESSWVEIYTDIHSLNIICFCVFTASLATKSTSCTPKFVFVKDFSGKDVDIEIHQCTTVFDIKQHIQLKTKVPVVNQKLIYGGSILDNHVSVITYGMLYMFYVQF